MHIPGSFVGMITHNGETYEVWADPAGFLFFVNTDPEKKFKYGNKKQSQCLCIHGGKYSFSDYVFVCEFPFYQRPNFEGKELIEVYKILKPLCEATWTKYPKSRETFDI